MSLPEFRTILRHVLSIVTYNTMFYIKRQTRGQTDVQVIPEVLTDSINRITITTDYRDYTYFHGEGYRYKNVTMNNLAGLGISIS